jgi:hypothetical protein
MRKRFRCMAMLMERQRFRSHRPGQAFDGGNMVSREASGRCVDGEVVVVLQHEIRYRLSII